MFTKCQIDKESCVDPCVGGRACANIGEKSVTFADVRQTDGNTSVAGEPTKLNRKPMYAQVAKRRLDRVG